MRLLAEEPTMYSLVMRILVTGSDIGVGKTWVACALARALRDSGKSVVAIKPVETGCSGRPTRFEDGVRLAAATGQAAPTHAILRLAEPLAPVLASERAGDEIDFDALVLKIERFAEQADYAIVVGAGGLLTPVTWEWNIADVARSLGAAALVVGEDRLGTINHTLLTLSALELAGLPCLGVILTALKKPDRSTGTNAAAIARLSGIERVIALPQGKDQKVATRAIEPVLGWFGRVAVMT
jgi:dethiobiotin synthetase